jgi:membrane-associated phospholipid phosphatase
MTAAAGGNAGCNCPWEDESTSRRVVHSAMDNGGAFTLTVEKEVTMQGKSAGIFSRGIFGTGWRNALIDILLAVGVYIANEIYVTLNHGPAVLHLATPLDGLIPVVPVFVIPYVSLQPYVYLTLIVLLLFRTRLFQSACLALTYALLISYGFYIFLQSEMIRPVLAGGDALTAMIRDVYASDNPFNCFPSLHTASSVIMAVFWWRLDRRAGIAAALWTALIVASTVLIKQHYLPDLLAGLLLASGVSWIFIRLVPQKT